MKNFLRFFMYFVIFAALGAAGAYLFSEKAGFWKAGQVPLLEGKSIAEAGELLKKRKLTLSVKGQEANSEIPEGHIIRQLAGSGNKIPAGSEVGVIVSRGKAEGILSIPSFEDQLLNEAKMTVANLDMKLGKVTWVHSDTVEKEKIIAQRPLPGSVNSSEINFIVSLGPYDVLYKCPSFVNMTVEAARTLSEELGIGLNEKGEGNKIVSQKPGEGEMIRRGDLVEVTLGSGRWMWF
ncbi:MAG: PASTA domain-containing protein [Nitrospiraceae bacterium]|nr:MAG: PASTA domain-containing protein [Nitrospiraceae bacterium]